RYPGESPQRRRLEARYTQPALWDAFLACLAQNGYGVPRPLLTRDPTRPIEPSVELQRVLVDVYRRDPVTSQVCERLVDLDEGFQEWRYRHVKMVERTIGTRRGSTPRSWWTTCGSARSPRRTWCGGASLAC